MRDLALLGLLSEDEDGNSQEVGERLREATEVIDEHVNEVFQDL